MLKSKFKVLLVLIVLSFLFFSPTLLFSQSKSASETTSVTTWILADFDDHSKSNSVNIYNGGRHKVVWDVRASRFITRTNEKPYPLKAYLVGAPVIIPSEYKREPEAMRIFAIRAAFNSKGYNDLYLYPTDENAPVILGQDGEPLKGIFFHEPIYQIGLYAMGILRDFRISVVFESIDGQSFSVFLGKLNYKGWKVLVADVPIGHYVNESTYLNERYILRLEKIVIQTTPQEDVSDFVIYLDQIFYTLPSVNDRYYDGYELSRPDFKYNLILKNGEGTKNIEWVPGAEDQDNPTTNQE